MLGKEATDNIYIDVNQAKPNQTRRFLDVGVGFAENGSVRFQTKTKC
jgi:hypothetical protein